MNKNRKRYSFDAGTEAWLEAEAAAARTTVADLVARMAREKRDERSRESVMEMYAVSKSGPVLGVDGS